MMEALMVILLLAMILVELWFDRCRCWYIEQLCQHRCRFRFIKGLAARWS